MPSTAVIPNADDQRSEARDLTQSTPTLSAAHTHWGGTLLATTDGSGNISISYLHQDLLGTKRLETDVNGNQIGSFTSLPFGDNLASSNLDDDPQHFALQDHDTESSTEHADFRQYASDLARWLSPDPYDESYDAGNPQSLNRYAYALNNPLLLVDPSGLDPCPKDDGTSNGKKAHADCEENYRVAVQAAWDAFLLQHRFLDFQLLSISAPTIQVTSLPSPPSNTGSSNNKSKVPSKLVVIAQCASNAANAVSAASLLPSNAPKFLQNLLSNDASSISDLLTGPDRTGAAVSVAQGKGLNTVGRAVGNISYGKDRLILNQTNSGNYYVQEILDGTIANTAAGKGLAKLIGVVSAVKFGYDFGTYLEAAYLCRKA